MSAQEQTGTRVWGRSDPIHTSTVVLGPPWDGAGTVGTGWKLGGWITTVPRRPTARDDHPYALCLKGTLLLFPPWILPFTTQVEGTKPSSHVSAKIPGRSSTARHPRPLSRIKSPGRIGGDANVNRRGFPPRGIRPASVLRGPSPSRPRIPLPSPTFSSPPPCLPTRRCSPPPGKPSLGSSSRSFFLAGTPPIRILNFEVNFSPSPFFAAFRDGRRTFMGPRLRFGIDGRVQGRWEGRGGGRRRRRRRRR